MIKIPSLNKDQKNLSIKMALAIILLLWVLFARENVIAHKVQENAKIKGLVVTGVIKSFTEVDIKSSVVGIIEKIYKFEGELVEKGELLCTLIPKEAQGNVDDAKGKLDAKKAHLEDLETEPRIQEVQIAEAKIAEAKANVKVLESELQEVQIKLKDAISIEAKYTILFKEGAISEREYENSTFLRAEMEKKIDKLRNEINSSKAKVEAEVSQFELTKIKIKGEQLKVAKAEVESAKGQLKGAHGQLDKHIIRSPMNGYIIDVPKRAGDAANEVSTILKMVDLENIYMLLKVEEQNLQDLKTNQKVVIVFDAYPEKLIDGNIGIIINSIDVNSGTFLVEIKFKKPYSKNLYPGMKGDATIFIEEYKNKIIIPLKFILYENNKMYVMKKFGPIAYKKLIKARLFGENKMYVIEGLKKNDIIFKKVNGKKLSNFFRFRVKKVYKD